MKTFRLILTISLIFIIPSLSSAQVGNLLRNKVSRVVESGTKAIDKQINKEIDTAAQKGAENLRDKAYENAEKNRSEAEQEDAGQPEARQGSKGINIGGLMGGKVSLKYDESYSFTGRMFMQMEMYDKQDVVKMDYYIYFSDSNLNGGFESKIKGTSEEAGEVTVTSNMVFDGEKKVFIMLSDMGAVKMGIISEVPDESTLQAQYQEKTSKPTITKTGNNKTIAGYKCDEYLYKDNDSGGHGKLWVTKDLKLKGDNRIYSKAGLPSYYGDSQLEGGAVLAMETYNNKNELEMKSETREINMNYKHNISTAGYNLRQMNFNQAGGKNK